jgi:hypothetical protein
MAPPEPPAVPARARRSFGMLSPQAPQLLEAHVRHPGSPEVLGECGFRFNNRPAHLGERSDVV